MSEWTRPAQPVRCVVELDKPLVVRRERGVLAQGDANANAIVAEVYSTAGKPYDLSGCTMQLIFVRPDNNALPAIDAEISANTATATLPDSAYAMSGMYSLRMQLRKNGAERTIVWIIGEVKGTDVDGIADPEHVISIGDIMASAKEAQTAASAANTAAQRANAGAERAEQLQIDANGLAGDSNNLGGKPPEYYLLVWNLLNNPDFAIAQAGRPVWDATNQKWTSGLNGSIPYAADRWEISGGVVSVTDVDGGFVLSNSTSGGVTIRQLAPRGHLVEGDAYTFAVYYSDGTKEAINLTQTSYSGAYCASGLYVGIGQYGSDKDRMFLLVPANTTIKPIKTFILIPGTYTAETMPTVVPRPYAVELAECMLYWQKLHRIMVYTKGNAKWLDVFVNFPPMRVTPTVIIKNAELNGTPIDVSGMIGYCDGSNRGISSVQDTKGQFGVSAFQRVYLDIELNANM